jgi:PLP dependent protein
MEVIMEYPVKDNILAIRRNIAAAATKAGRNPAEVKLMAVSKTVDDQRILAAIDAGVDMVGENYIQEAKRKIESMGHGIEWHFIGHLQTNKAKYAVKLFDMIHSVDRMELAQELDKRSANFGKTSNVLIEVNVSGEASKSGVPLNEALTLVAAVSELKHLSIQGLMTMPPWFDNPEDARPYFVALRELKERINLANIDRVQMRELSMGMSGDYQVAIEEGSTIVRIGTAIFGKRPS